MGDGIGDGIWSASDRGDTSKVSQLLAEGKDGNARNCLGCTPLLYACGSGHLQTVQTLLSHPSVDVNRRNNDRLTSFMLAMQGGPLLNRLSGDGSDERHSGNAQEKMRRLMNLPATDDLEWTRHDRWTALMEACNFGHGSIVDFLISLPHIDLDAVNLRGQRAEEVALSRGYDSLSEIIQKVRISREHPEELPRIRELEKQVSELKSETRNKLIQCIDLKYEALRDAKIKHEHEINPLTIKINNLQEELDAAMQLRMTLITQQVREITNVEEEIRQTKRKLENFDRYASSGSNPRLLLGAQSTYDSTSDLSVFEKDFECSVCLEEMKPPIKIFQCENGHVMCETCKSHPEVVSCPSCRIPFIGISSLMRNIPMEKLARSYYERRESCSSPFALRGRKLSGTSSPRAQNSKNSSRRGSREQLGPPIPATRGVHSNQSNSDSKW